VFVEILIVAVLTVVNGLLAMSELAVVSSRPARLQVMADKGSRGAATAIRLAQNPGRFLSSVQIGITLVGVLSGAFSGATLGGRLGDWLVSTGIEPGLASAAGLGIVVVAITYMSLIIGELVPKQIALRNPEGVAARVAPLMAGIALVAAPVVWLLDISGRLVLGLLGQKGKTEGRVTEEEVRTIIAEATSAGVLETDERAMITGVMRLADRSARGLMTPRRDVEMVDLSDSPEAILKQLRSTDRSTLPAQDGEADAIIGVIRVKDLLDVVASGKTFEPRALVHKAPVVMDRAGALDVLRAIRSASVHMALIFDEYGHFEGVVTTGDVMEAITGSYHEEEGEELAFTRRDDGSYLVSGWMQVDEFIEQLGVNVERDDRYETVAGFVLAELGHLPLVSESFERNGWRFEVVDLDGRRIDKVLINRIA
jgi:putative hemolysin